MLSIGSKVISSTGVTGQVIELGPTETTVQVLVYTGETIIYEKKFLKEITN